jgi:hypothetical protein
MSKNNWKIRHYQGRRSRTPPPVPLTTRPALSLYTGYWFRKQSEPKIQKIDAYDFPEMFLV